MSRRDLSGFIDAIAGGRRPKRFRADADDIEVVRAAIDLRAARPGEAEPTAEFTERLFQQLSEQAGHQQQPTPLRTPARHRGRTAWLVAAAAVVLVGATAAITETVTSTPPTRSATQVPQGSALRTGTFLSTDGQVVGQIVASRGTPSWVFMNVAVPHYDGTITCTLQVEDGSTVAFGTFTVARGIGQFSKSIGSVDVGRLRGARLVTSSGSPVAAATFAT